MLKNILNEEITVFKQIRVSNDVYFNWSRTDLRPVLYELNAENSGCGIEGLTENPTNIKSDKTAGATKSRRILHRFSSEHTNHKSVAVLKGLK